MSNSGGPESGGISPETVKQNELMMLTRELGFTETQRMAELRAQAIEAMRQRIPDDIVVAMTEYHSLAEKIVEEKKGYEEQTAATIALMVSIGAMYLEGGYLNDFDQELDEAALYAWNLWDTTHDPRWRNLPQRIEDYRLG